MNDIRRQHDRKIRELARQYSDRGFKVIVEPKGRQLPSFLRELGYEPDLIAKSPEESFVFEVSTRNSADKLARMSKVATIVNDRAKWKFVLVMTNPKVVRPTLTDYKLRSVLELRQSVQDLNDLVSVSVKRSNQFNDMVILKAWSIIEAAIRIGVPREKNLSPRSLIRDAVMFGLISQRDGEFLQNVAELRNRIVHGFRVREPPEVQIGRLQDVIERLLHELIGAGV